MLFGVCGDEKMAALAARIGYDYIETRVAALLKPDEDDAAFLRAVESFRAAGLPCPVVNIFIPGTLPIVGPAADLGALEEYVGRVCLRARQAGVEFIVFGSGGARRVPDGYDRAKAWEQIVAFLRVCAPLAAANGATIVIEPLRSQESNIINSVAEGAQLARDVDRPAIQLLVDGFHWAVNDRSIEAIVDNGPILRHAHIATTPNRRPPGAEECDLATFFQALKKSGYDARISIEGKIENPELELPAALKIMKALWER